MDIGSRITSFIRDEPVLAVSIVLALLSMLLVPPSAAYLDYIDIEVICILFCFMAAVVGISECGLFDTIAGKLVGGTTSVKLLCLALVVITFVSSMFITNDMALITFVPLAIVVLTMTGRTSLLIPVVVMQTVAANLGCMLTPFGSPHNLLVFSLFDAPASSFFSITAPLVAVGAVIMVVMTLAIGKGHLDRRTGKRSVLKNERFLAVMLLMFLLSVAAVLDVIPYWIVLIIVLASVLVLRPSILKKVDYGLLLTFVFLFIFTGNIAQVDIVSQTLGSMMSWDPVMTTVIACQFVSNVPATIMLSGFTEDWAGLLAGVNIGGFGTPIASMASVISMNLYFSQKDADKKKFMTVFLGVNVVMLAALLATWYLM